MRMCLSCVWEFLKTFDRVECLRCFVRRHPQGETARRASAARRSRPSTRAVGAPAPAPTHVDVTQNDSLTTMLITHSLLEPPRSPDPEPPRSYEPASSPGYDPPSYSYESPSYGDSGGYGGGSSDGGGSTGGDW